MSYRAERGICFRNLPARFLQIPVSSSHPAATIPPLVCGEWSVVWRRWSMGRIDFFLGVSSLILFLALPAPGCAQSAGNSVNLTGTVYSQPENQRVPHASEYLCDDGGNVLEQTNSSDSGEFAFRGLRPGRYILKIRADGFDSAELHVDLSLGSERGLAVSLRAPQSSPQQFPAGSTISARELSIPQDARDLLTSGKRKLHVDKNQQSAPADFQPPSPKCPPITKLSTRPGWLILPYSIRAKRNKAFANP